MVALGSWRGYSRDGSTMRKQRKIAAQITGEVKSFIDFWSSGMVLQKKGLESEGNNHPSTLHTNHDL